MSRGTRRIGAAAVGVAIGLAAALVVVAPASVPSRPGVAGPVAASASPWYPAWLRPDDPDTAGLDRGCSRSLVRGVLGSFFDAFNRRDQQALAALFSPDFGPEPGGFPGGLSVRSFSDHDGDTGGRPRPFQTSDPWELPSYFASRWAQSERWVLRELRIREDSTVGPAAAWFQIAYDRTADDLPASFIAGGKGGINCAERTIRVWAVGDHAPWGTESGPSNLPPAVRRTAKKAGDLVEDGLRGPTKPSRSCPARVRRARAPARLAASFVPDP